MKRREFGRIAGAGLMSAGVSTVVGSKALAQTAPDASQLDGPVLTPMGSERAGNAAGTIPAWTGGMSEAPAGFTYSDGAPLQDFFKNDPMLYEITSANLSQYKDLISEGVQYLIAKKGFSVQVYPSHRTHMLPQYVYDNTKANVGRAKAVDEGIRFGFVGAYGGYPFPIPDSDPLIAGGQILCNHEVRFPGDAYVQYLSVEYVSVNGVISLTDLEHATAIYDYYLKDGSVDTYSGYTYKLFSTSSAPANQVGAQLVHWDSTNVKEQPSITWELLPGQGRVRKAPEVMYDVPASFLDGMANYDEYYGWAPPYDRYDVKLLGKMEKLVPYNNNKIFSMESTECLQPNFFSPDAMRWELHRCWVLEATLHPGNRNVLARRVLYVDEDCWTVVVADGYDADNNLFHHSQMPVAAIPGRGQISFADIVYNLQTGTYASVGTIFGNAPYNSPYTYLPVTEDQVNPQAMAASANY
jgi:hypothetical protein